MSPELLLAAWIAGPGSELHARRNVGLLVIKVVEAEGLKKMDTFGKADPFVGGIHAGAPDGAHGAPRPCTREAGLRVRCFKVWGYRAISALAGCHVPRARAPSPAPQHAVSGCSTTLACHTAHTAHTNP